MTILVIIGVTMISSSIAGNIELTTETPLVQRQIIFAVAGFVALLVMASIDYRFWGSLSTQLYVGMVLVLLALNIIGAALFGSARWFRTTLVFIQPSEFAKIVLILVLADFFARRLHLMSDPKTTVRSFLIMMGITIWVILQPNLSTSIVLIVLWLVLVWIAGLPVRHMIAYALTGVAILSITFPLLVEFEIIKAYQLNRITNFIAPVDPDDLTARYGDRYNIDQALVSIGSGGLFGQGYGQGPQVQLRFLKVRWSDFIFAATTHELGFAGAVLVILLLAFVIYRCLWAARAAPDAFGALICYGVATLIGFQALVNLGVNLNLLPATGLTLPFVSYGGSSLVANMIALGLVESVIMRRKAIES
ncbi:MAG: FtsW/RodA/SpoVE family cell cycle protein [Anaerolineales bacterium]